MVLGILIGKGYFVQKGCLQLFETGACVGRGVVILPTWLYWGRPPSRTNPNPNSIYVKETGTIKANLPTSTQIEAGLKTQEQGIPCGPIRLSSQRPLFNFVYLYFLPPFNKLHLELVFGVAFFLQFSNRSLENKKKTTIMSHYAFPVRGGDTPPPVPPKTTHISACAATVRTPVSFRHISCGKTPLNKF